MGIVAAVQRVELHNRRLHVELGNVAEWAAAVGTVAAFGIAVWVFLYGNRIRIQAERREQAELITAWMRDYHLQIFKEATEGAGQAVKSSYSVGIINASQVVVYDVLVVLSCEHRAPPFPDKFLERSTLMAPEPIRWEPRRDRLAWGKLAVLPPGRVDVSVRLTNTSVRAVDLNIFFRDHRGVYWRRAVYGRLTEMPEPSANDEKDRCRRMQIEQELGEGPSDAPVCYLVAKPLDEA